MRSTSGFLCASCSSCRSSTGANRCVCFTSTCSCCCRSRCRLPTSTTGASMPPRHWSIRRSSTCSYGCSCWPAWLVAARPDAKAPSPLRLLVPAPWLAIGVVFLIGFRVGLNVTDSNVIDVGYAGVIGAQRITQDRSLYGKYPSDNEHGDTYGPVNYETYVPFQQILGWSGHWDDLPAAHAAAIVFDLLAVALLFLLGRRVRGPGLGIALAYAWVSYPFTLFALESNSNDSLVAVFILAALLVASSPPPEECSRHSRASRSSPHSHSRRSSGPTASSGLTAWRRACSLGAVRARLPGDGRRSCRSRRSPTTRCTRSTSARLPTSQIANPPSRSGGYMATPPLDYATGGGPRRLPRACPAVAVMPRRADLVGLACHRRCRARGRATRHRPLVLSLHPLVLRAGDAGPARPVQLAGREIGPSHQDLFDRVSSQRLSSAYEHAHQPWVLLGGLKAHRHLRDERLHGLLALDPDHAARVARSCRHR